MTFSPILPYTGLSGWNYLKSSQEKQKTLLSKQSDVKRETAYYKENIGKINTAEELVKDYRLLKYTLTAFGLESDISNKFFIKKILESDSLKTDSLANKMTNKQYVKLANSFGFGTYKTPKSKISDFAEKISNLYNEKTFQIAVGEKNQTLRVALNTETELPSLAAASSSETAKWYSILANAPLRKVFEGAFGLPSSFATIDIDKQVATLKRYTNSMFGSDNISQFTDQKLTEKLIKKYVIQTEISDQGYQSSPAYNALNLFRI